MVRVVQKIRGICIHVVCLIFQTPIIAHLGMALSNVCWILQGYDFALHALANEPAPRCQQLYPATLVFTATTDDDGEDMSRGSSMYEFFQQAQQFVGKMGASLQSVTSIQLQVALLHPLTTPAEDMPASLERKLPHITNAARHILALLALACPKLQRLHVTCPDVLTAIPTHLCSQLHTLALGSCNFGHHGYKEHSRILLPKAVQEDRCAILHLQPLLARLTNLTLGESSIDFPLLPYACLSACTALTPLDLGCDMQGARLWMSLPPNVQELRCFLPYPSPASHAHLIPRSLRRCVFPQGHQQSVADFMDVLTYLPHVQEVVFQQVSAPLLEAGQPEEKQEPACLVVYVSNAESMAALDQLHKRLSAGMKLTTEHWLEYPQWDSPPNRSQGFQLLIYEQDMTFVIDSDDEEELVFHPLTEYLQRLQPWPLFKHVVLVFSSAVELQLLPVMFPNLCSLSLSYLDNPRMLKPLAVCTLLHTLVLHSHGKMAPTSLAAVVSSLSSLMSFRCGPLSGAKLNHNVGEGLLLTQLLRKSNPSLTVVVDSEAF